MQEERHVPQHHELSVLLQQHDGVPSDPLEAVADTVPREKTSQPLLLL